MSSDENFLSADDEDQNTVSTKSKNLSVERNLSDVNPLPVSSESATENMHHSARNGKSVKKNRRKRNEIKSNLENISQGASQHKGSTHDERKCGSRKQERREKGVRMETSGEKEQQTVEENEKCEYLSTDAVTNENYLVPQNQKIGRNTDSLDRRDDEAQPDPSTVLDRLSLAAESHGSGSLSSGGWGSWGSTVMNTASFSISTFAGSVGEGFSSVVETVDASLKPEFLVEPGEGKVEEKPPEKAGVSKAVTGGWGWNIGSISAAGQNFLSNGLGVLETIGRTTFDVLAEGDHGLKKKLSGPNLSQTLREAALNSLKCDSEPSEEELAEQRVNFGLQFESRHGLAHLESLEDLSHQAECQLHALLDSLPKEILMEHQSELLSFSPIFQVEEQEEDGMEFDFPKEVERLMDVLDLPCYADKIIECGQDSQQALADLERHEVLDLQSHHEAAILALANLSACSVQFLHKVSQLIGKFPFKLVERAKVTVNLTNLVCLQISAESEAYVQKLHQLQKDSPDSSAHITNIYLEAVNAKSLLRSAVKLLLPSFQIAAIQLIRETKQS